MKASRLELKIGARVETTDGPYGHIRQVILDPSQGRVTGLVVRAGLVPAREWLVPTELISNATDERVALRISSAEIRKQPVFDPSRFLSVEAEAPGYQEGEALVFVENVEGGSKEHPQSTMLAGHKVALRSGQAAWGTDGRVGRVDLLLMNFHGQVRHFVIRKGGLLSQVVIVPVDGISRIDRRGIWLMTERAALQGLPSYRPDAALAEDVDRALWMDEVLRAIDYDAIDIHVHDGVVTLRGFASTLMIKKRAERAARTVPGVLEVDNRIMTDEEISIAVSQALGRDERTRHLRILVSAKHGVVTLNGEFDSAEERSIAEEVAASVPQVRGVLNYIRAPCMVVEPVNQRVLQPPIGGAVYAQDLFLGSVERVMISPHHRRVTAFVVRGNFPDLEHTRPGMLPVELPHEERQVLIPINIVKFVTQGGVLLTINGVAAARHHDFDPGNFIPPDPEWQPPYPYTHRDILLDAEGNVPEEVAAIHIQSNTRSNR